MQIDLLYYPVSHKDGNAWSLGDTRVLMEPVARTATILKAWLATTRASHVLLWDMRLGAPDEDTVREVATLPGDVWHAGLRLGMGGRPGLLKYVVPGWMLGMDPDADPVATSWRLSVGACLVKVDVLRQLGGLDPAYETLAGASLDFGYRLLKAGVFTRHVPYLVPEDAAWEHAEPTAYDEMRFICRHHGKRWGRWALCRATVADPRKRRWLRAYRRARAAAGVPRNPAFVRPSVRDHAFEADGERVSVLIPTLHRYPYLRNELIQLGNQTVPPHEVIVIDQTATEERYTDWAADFPELPLRYIPQDTRGQCTAWNAGVEAATGDYVLFLGDDADRIRPDLIELFLRTFHAWQVDMVGCAVEEVDAEVHMEQQAFPRIADGFPIAMVRRALFRESGLLDYAFDRGARADQDLGVRMYRRGGFMVLNPEINVLHHRAPTGGLRAHKARTITFASSRENLTHRHIPSITEMYLLQRHFAPAEIREALWMRAMGTLSLKGSRLRRLAKVLWGGLLLPDTFRRFRRHFREAEELLDTFPQIPHLPPEREAKPSSTHLSK